MRRRPPRSTLTDTRFPYPTLFLSHESEEGQEALLRNAARPTSESEAGPKPAPDGSLRMPKQDRTVRNDRINEVRTVPRARALQNLRLPEDRKSTRLNSSH